MGIDKPHNDFDDIDWDKEVEISDVELEQSLADIHVQVANDEVNKLSKALRASAGRAIKALNKAAYFTRMRDHHLNIVLKKAKLLYDENSKEYQDVAKFVELWKG